MREIWKKTKYEGYEISNFGNVRSFWFNRYLQDIPQKILNPTIGNHGYYVVCLSGGMRSVHRLVLEAFKGISSKWGCHKDGNKLNNKLSNLRWGTPKSNSKDRDKHGTRWIANKHPNTKLNHKSAQEIRQKYAQGNTSHRKLAIEYGVSYCAIKYLLQGKTWGGSY